MEEKSSLGIPDLMGNGIVGGNGFSVSEAELLRELKIAVGMKEQMAKEMIEWRGKYYETLHHLRTAHRGLERYARRQRRWREEVAGLRARLGVRERLQRVR